jgi:hypothetical protein
MLPPELHGVAAPQPCIKQDRQCQALARPDWPVRLETVDLIFRPNAKSLSARPRRLDAGRRIGCDEFGGDRPSEQAAQGLKEIPRLKRGVLAAVNPGGDRFPRDFGIWSVAGRCDDVDEEILALSLRRRG